MSKRAIPVHLLTGFFGTGKTTLINRALATEGLGRRVAIMVNDFGDVTVDSEMIERGHANVPAVHSVAGGSIFCSCRHWDFVTGLHALANHKPDVIIVEASGMADPSPVKMDIKIASDLDLNNEYVHASTVCLVDAVMFKEQVEIFPVVHRQVKHASHVIINKVDLIASPVEPEKAALLAAVRRINKEASVEFTTGAAVRSTLFFGVPVEWVDEGRPDRSLNEPGNQPRTLVLVASRQVKREAVVKYYAAVKDKLLRFKGFCHLEDGWYSVNAVADQIRFSATRVPRGRSEILCILPPGDKAIPRELHDLWSQIVG